MKIIKNLIAASKYSLKCPYAMTPELIVVHNTANDASAKNEVAYMQRNGHSTSFHFAVDDKEIVQGLPLDRNAWHAGDGKKGDGNRKGIAIEICYSRSGGDKFAKAERLASKFIAQLLHERGWGMDRVCKHQDFSGKYCPHRTIKYGWGRFLEMVEDELNDLISADKDRSPDWVRILKDKASHPDAWIKFVEASKDHPTGKYLPDLILKLCDKK